MAFWWASQNHNYSTAIQQGTLWTFPNSDTRIAAGRLLIKSLRVDDIVFNYANTRLRAISRVIEEWVPSARPPGYGDGNEIGWLVRVQPIVTDLNLHFRQIASLIANGSPGPLSATGQPLEKYLSALGDNDAANLLNYLQVSVARDVISASPLPDVHEVWNGGLTDAVTLAQRRREQRSLRSHLLDGRDTAVCGLCGRVLPARLIVAAHIIPRAGLSEEQRKDFTSVAMLVCTLGCDQLFENGYVYVDGSGRIRAGRIAAGTDLPNAVSTLVDRRCTAHTPRTAENFAAHAKLVSA